MYNNQKILYNMIGFLHFVIVFRILHINYAVNVPVIKEKPENCYGTDDVMNRKCCIFPPFFNRDTARQCGMAFAVTFVDRSADVAILRRGSNTNCHYWRCILNKYNILDSEKNISVEKYYDHLDKWVNLNPAFSNVLLKAKTHCKQDFKMYMPLDACQFFDFQNCIRNYVNLDCPDVIQSKKCTEWKQFYDECREFFI